MHEAKLKPLLWSPGWIPFSAFNATVALVLDLEPGVGGSYGQVFGYHAGFDQESDEVVLASSFSEFSERLLSDLQSHNYSVQDGTVEFDDEWI